MGPIWLYFGSYISPQKIILKEIREHLSMHISSQNMSRDYGTIMVLPLLYCESIRTKPNLAVWFGTVHLSKTVLTWSTPFPAMYILPKPLCPTGFPCKESKRLVISQISPSIEIEEQIPQFTFVYGTWSSARLFFFFDTVKKKPIQKVFHSCTKACHW